MLFSSFFFLLCSLFLRDDVTGEKKMTTEKRANGQAEQEERMKERKKQTRTNKNRLHSRWTTFFDSMSSAATLESPSKSSTHNDSTTHSNGNGVTAVVVTNPLASSSFSSTTSRYQSSVMNKYKNLATPDLTHPLSSLKQMTHVLTNSNGNGSALDPHAYLASKYVSDLYLWQMRTFVVDLHSIV